MKRSISIISILKMCCVIGFAAFGISGQANVTGKDKAGGYTAVSSFNSISKEEIEMLMADLAKTSPVILKQLSKDPEMKRQQIDNLKQLLAFASQAQKDGLTDDPINLQELENVRSEVVAVNHDKEINKNKGPMPPFGFITEARVKRFWDEGGWDREAEFQKFLDSKVAVLKQSNPEMKDRETSEEEKTQARDFFAKIEIYEKEFVDKVASGLLTRQFKEKVDLQVKLQQAQFLTRIYSDKIADDAKATDGDIAKYIAEHPELNTTGKKVKAEEILKRAKAGEDFAALANEFSEDPGNKSPKGKPLGGIYTNVTKGKMLAPFEEAALALEPGQIVSNIVETDFGYHIIKLEKKGERKDATGKPEQTYDVRHILIDTTYTDPAAPDEGGKPVKTYVRAKLETEKEKHLVDKIVADNNIQVPEDFTIPEIADMKTPKTVKKQPVRKKRMVKKR